jgi:hypothetical protein
VFYLGRRVGLDAVKTVGCDDPRRVGEAGPLRGRGERSVAGDGPPVVGGREETGRVGLAGEKAPVGFLDQALEIDFLS